MCGIAGWVDWERDLSTAGTVLEEMVKVLIPRGPDESGFWLARHAAMGHRRLVVVDPAGGGQPMIRKHGDDTFCLIYNGELYNTIELRRELESRGYAFTGHSDTEVLLVSFIEWGEECVYRLNGIYAFGIWSEKEQSLFLARDRLGVKPLFYTRLRNGLLFASEIKALLAHGEVEPAVDAEGLAEIFGLGPSRTPGHGVFKGLSELRPGYYMVCNGRGVRMRRYWKLESRPHRDDLATTVAKVRALLQDTVERQLVADVPVCALLSGGLDSSAITAFAAAAFRKAGNPEIHTYSIDYRDNDRYFTPNSFQPDSDAPWIKLMVDFLGSKHHYVTVDTPQLTEALTDAVRARDLPGMADVDSSLLLFCREIKKGATVGLSGESADEVFGGYPWFHRHEALLADNFPWLTALEGRERILSPEVLKTVKPREYVVERYRQTINEAPRLPGEDPLEARRREISYLNIIWFLTTLLDRKDRMSMATGLEVRVPYCDHRIVEYVWNIPWEMKTCGGREKGLLRKALEGVLPQEVLERKKSPYPKTHNPNYLKAVQTRLSEVLNDKGSPLLPLINIEVVKDLLAKGDFFSRPWFGQLMTGPQFFAYLIQVDFWLREYRVKVM